MARKKHDDLYVVDLLDPGEKELIRRVKEAELFTRDGWDLYGEDWPDYIPRAPNGKPIINAFTHYFFGGFRFLERQAIAHYSPVPDLQIMGGVGSGKTTPTAISSASRASLNPGHDVLWVAPILPQAKLAYEIILNFGVNNRWGEVFLLDSRRSPYPIIELRPWDKNDPGSRIECRSLGQDPAELLRGGEFTEAVADEAMRAYPTTWYIALITGRLRGPNQYRLNASPKLRDEYASRVEEIEWVESRKERERLRDDLEEWVAATGLAKQTRLTVIGNAPRGAEWWRRWERGLKHPEERYSARWSTYDNLYVSRKQLRLQERQYRGRQDELRTELDAMRPPASGDVFPHLESLFSGDLLAEAVQNVAEDEPGWVVHTHEEIGLYHYEKPVEEGATYAFALDPGTGVLPGRNKWVLMGARIDQGPNSDPPVPFEIVYFRAGNLPGQHGSPDPWIHAAKDVRSRYPIPFGMFATESSGVQKNTHWVVWRDDLVLTPIYLNNVLMTLIIQAQRTVGADMWWAPDCQMFSDEMSEFRYDMKKTDPQDTVSCFVILNHLLYPFVKDRWEAPREPEEAVPGHYVVGREARDGQREVRIR